MRAGDVAVRDSADHGAALVTVLALMGLMSALALALALMSALETRAAFNFRASSEALFAADAGVERALPDLAAAADWSAVLNGSAGSTFDDGTRLVRVPSDGRTLSLFEVVNRATCGHAAACTPAEIGAVTAARPWGLNNPQWRIYMQGPLGSLAPGVTPRSGCLVVVLVADDPSENDDDPLRDGVPGSSTGAGVLLIRSEAFGPAGTHKVIEATITRDDPASGAATTPRLVSWREIREPGS